MVQAYVEAPALTGFKSQLDEATPRLPRTSGCLKQNCIRLEWDYTI